MSYALLDPDGIDQDGEWAPYVYKGWGGEGARDQLEWSPSEGAHAGRRQ
ncbi:hypothetical protein [Streptomyces sp. S.PB5]|nr:hypothetical protein [Streptomyces sp. S.PB5]MDN3025989.1 hypothetical protein [Streptomyces sp. S.PB5]